MCSWLQQSETPYWQGVGSPVLAPQPWENSLLPSDPTFSWCATDDAQCRMAVYQRVAKSTDVNVYGAGFWTFFNGIHRNGCSAECQQNAMIYEDNERLFSYGISTHNVRTMVLEGTGGTYKNIDKRCCEFGRLAITRRCGGCVHTGVVTQDLF